MIFYVKVMWLTLWIQFKVFGLSEKVCFFCQSDVGISWDLIQSTKDFRPRHPLI